MASPLGIKPDGTASHAALKKIKEMAEAGTPVAAIAVHFGYTKRKFHTWMDRNKGENDIRHAWEHGKALHEAWLQQKFMEMASSKANGALGALCFLAKTQHQWREVPEAKATQVGVQIVLPGSYSREEWEKKMAAEGPPCFDVTPQKALD